MFKYINKRLDRATVVVEENLPNVGSDGQENLPNVGSDGQETNTWIVDIFQLLKHVGEYLNFQFSFDIHLLKD